MSELCSFWRLKLYSLNYANAVVVFVFNNSPTADVVWRRDQGIKSHPTDWRSWGLNRRPLFYKASGLSTNTIAAPYAFAHAQTILFGLSEFVILVLHFNTRKLTCLEINFEFNKFVKICKVSKTNSEY